MEKYRYIQYRLIYISRELKIQVQCTTAMQHKYIDHINIYIRYIHDFCFYIDKIENTTGECIVFLRCWKCSFGRCFNSLYILFVPSDTAWTSKKYLRGRTGQELQFIEFFAGEANCFAKVKQAYPAAAVDLEYLSQSVGPHSNSFDILTPAGLAFFGMKQWGVFGRSILFKMHSHRHLYLGVMFQKLIIEPLQMSPNLNKLIGDGQCIARFRFFNNFFEEDVSTSKSKGPLSAPFHFAGKYMSPKQPGNLDNVWPKKTLF